MHKHIICTMYIVVSLFCSTNVFAGTEEDRQLLNGIGTCDLVITANSIKNGANINAKIAELPLLHYAILKCNVDIVHILIDNRADVNIKNDDGITALMLSSLSGYIDIMSLLIDSGADVNVKSNNGATALILASGAGHAEIVRILLNKKADVNAKSDNGSTALIVAKERGYADIAQLLSDNGADINAKRLDATQLLREHISNSNSKDKNSAVNQTRGEEEKAEHFLQEGHRYYASGYYLEAISNFKKALEIATKVDNKEKVWHAHGNLGSVYGDLGNSQSAIKHLENALLVVQQLGDKKGHGNLLNVLGNIYQQSLRNYPKAIEQYESAINIADTIGDKPGAGMAYGNLGLTYLHMGDFRKAITYCDKAMTTLGSDDKDVAKSTHHNLGLVYSDLGDHAKAIEYYEKALTLADKTRPFTRGSTFVNLGNEYLALGTPQKAIEYFEKAMAVAKGRTDTDTYEYCELSMADAFLAHGKDQQALAIYKKHDHSLRLGRYYLKQKDYKEAAKQFEREREQYEKIKDASIILSQWMGLGLSLEGLKEYETAYTWFTKAVALLEEQRASLSPLEREHFLGGKEFDIPRLEAYEGAVRCTFLQNNYDETFFWAENTRGRLFSELIASRHSKANYKIPQELAREEEELTSRIMSNKSQQQLAFKKNNTETLKELESEFSDLKQKLDTLIDRLRRNYPQYAAVRYPQPVKLNQIALKKGETIIEYEVTDPYTIGMVIQDGKVVKGFKIEKSRAELEYLIAKFRAPFQAGSGPGRFNQSLASELTELLLQPALSNIPKGDHLIIIPDEVLSLLPFEALPLPNTGAESQSAYLADHYPISYYQSATVLSQRRGLSISRAKETAFFGLGDPVYGKDDERTGTLRSLTMARQTLDITESEATRAAGYTFSRLPNTAKEVQEAGRLFSTSKLLLGPDASEEKVKAEDLSGMRYVLFSTHGILGNEVPYIKQPALVLNLLDNKEEDGFLTAGEIFGMNLNADIVGLSACKTGLGVQTAGEGVVGLSRAFMYAGADSVLVSLWSVSDESTYKLMVKFFDGLNAGKSKLASLREAKDHLRANGYDHPFYWAPFIIMGEVE